MNKVLGLPSSSRVMARTSPRERQAGVFLASLGRDLHAQAHRARAMRLHHLAPSPARAGGSASDVPGGVAAATADLPSKTLCPQSPASQAATSATSVQPMRSTGCRRHPGWHLPINELWHRQAGHAHQGKGLWWSAWLRWQPVLADLSWCRGTPDHAIQCTAGQALPAVASGLLNAPNGQQVWRPGAGGLH